MTLTAENYFSTEAEQHYMGSTQFKNFIKCEAAALARVRGEYVENKSTALLVGSYVDAHFSHELDLFKSQNPEIFTKSGELKSDYKKADEIINRIEQDEFFRTEISGQTQVIMTGEISGVPFKIKIDSLHPNRTVDLKVMKDIEDMWYDGEKAPFWMYYGYNIQAAIYREVRAQNDGEIKPIRLAPATKETATGLYVFEFTDETLQESLEMVKAYAPRFNAIKNGTIQPTSCGECDYCKARKVLTEKDIIFI